MTAPDARPMRSGDELLAIADGLLGAVTRGEAEVSVTETDTALTRFANNEIHQNVAERVMATRLRLIQDGRVAVVEARGQAAAEPAPLLAAAETALANMKAAEQTPLPRPDGGVDTGVGFSPATAACTPERRAEMVGTVVAAARRSALIAYGALTALTNTRAIASTTGVRRAATATAADIVTVMRGADGSGYAARSHADIDQIDAEVVAAEVEERCRRNQGAAPAAPGDYRVVLAPYAVAEMLSHLAMLGFSARAVQEQRSFMRLGERLMNSGVTIYDDAAEPESLAFPFDHEGVSTQHVTLIDRGVAHAVVQDSATAQIDGTASTGHALPMPNTWGPWAAHLAMAPGSASEQELLQAVSDGIYVTRFWYVRDVHPLRTVITGMTRDGTFRIRDGALAEPVRDLRFTQSIVEALDQVLAIGSERRLSSSEGEEAVLNPAIATTGFTFSS